MEIPIDLHMIQGSCIKRPKKRLIERSMIRILFDYPLDTVGPTADEKRHHGWIFEFKAPNGKFFTQGDLVRIIRSQYQQIYDEEDKTSNVKATTIPGMMNRAQTTGKFQIWGHVITDLALEGIKYNPKTNLVTLLIGS